MSLGSFLVGAGIAIVCALFVAFGSKIIYVLGGNLGDFEQAKKWAYIGIGVGVLIMFNLHTIILGGIFKSLFGGAQRL